MFWSLGYNMTQIYFHLIMYKYYTLYIYLMFYQPVSHIVVEASICFLHILFIFSLYSPHCILMDIIQFTYSYQVYRVVDTSLYLYALSINHLSSLTQVFISVTTVIISRLLEQVKKRNLVQGLHKRTQQRTLYRIVYLIY